MLAVLRVLIGVGIGGFLGPPAFADTNLVFNGDFSMANKISGWSCPGVIGALGSSAWSGDDAAGDASSGSLELTNVGAFFYCISTCIPVRPGAAYSLGAQTRLVDFGSEDSIDLTCCAYSNTTCTGTCNQALAVPTLSATTTWNGTPASANGTLPSYIQSVDCHAGLGVSGISFGTAHFDNVFFRTDVVFADGFEATGAGP